MRPDEGLPASHLVLPPASELLDGAVQQVDCFRLRNRSRLSHPDQKVGQVTTPLHLVASPIPERLEFLHRLAIGRQWILAGVPFAHLGHQRAG